MHRSRLRSPKLLSLISGLLLMAWLTILGVGSSLMTSAQATDTEAPSYVENVKATPGDGAIELTWDAATDNVGVTGYKIYLGTSSVEEAGDEYNLEAIEVENVLEYTVEDLENETMYYFAVTAMDAAGNESVEYSYEVSATPVSSGEEDDENPVVVSAKANDCDAVEVIFSEAVTYSEENPEEAFTIENLDTAAYLEVVQVSISEDNEKAVVLKTETMEEGAQYLLTVGIDVQDKQGNAIVSGTSDTAVFSGVVCATEETPSEEEEPVDTQAPELEEVTVVSATTLELKFDEEVVLPEIDEDDEGNYGGEAEDPALELFKITTTTDVTLEVKAVEYKETDVTDGEGNPVLDRTVLVLTTAEQVGEIEYLVTVTGLEDEAGNATEGDFKSSASYTTPPFEVPDTIAPEDVTNLVAQVVDMMVNLSWTASLNSAGDLIDQNLYVSTDGGTSYGDKSSLGKDNTKYTFEGGVEGGAYTFKVTTVDDNGNESAGTVVTATLPTTGAGIGALALASLLGGNFLSRRKK